MGKGKKMNVDIADRLAKKRRERGLSQEQLAEKLGVSRQAVSKWERSESSPDTDNLIALAQLYGTSLDDLLYVDDDIEDDVDFEKRDKAEKQDSSDAVKSQSAQCAAASSQGAPSTESPSPDEGAKESSSSSARGDGSSAKVHFGAGGMDVKDDKSYVHLSWRDGVHVKDNESGDEVHVGWSGIHVTEGGETVLGGKSSSTRPNDAPSEDAASSGNADSNASVDDFERPEDVAHVTYASWDEASQKWKDGYFDQSGEYHDGFEGRGRAARKFPIAPIVLLVYVICGIMWGTWGLGLFLFLLIPAYYIVVNNLVRAKWAAAIADVYTIGATAYFLWMAFMENQAHPAWVIFFTVPVVHWLCHSVSSWWRKRKKAASQPIGAEPLDTKPVDANPMQSKPVDAKPVDTKPVSADESVDKENR